MDKRVKFGIFGAVALGLAGEGMSRWVPEDVSVIHALFVGAMLFAILPITYICKEKLLLSWVTPQKLIVAVLGLWVAFFLWSESPLGSNCPPPQVSRNIINDNIGKLMDSGRKRAIECLAEAGENLTKLDIDYAYIGPLDLPPKTILNDARMVDTDLPGAKFPEAAMSGAKMSQATLNDVNFSGADLSGAILGSHLLFDDDKTRKGKPGCYMGASVARTIFDGANLSNAYLIEVRDLTCEQLRQAKNWELAIRTEDLRCDSKEPLPELPDYVREWGGTFEGCLKWKKELGSGTR